MNRFLQKLSILIALFALCLPLIGCGVKSQTKPQDQDLMQNQDNSPKEDASITDTSDEKEKIESVGIENPVNNGVSEVEIVNKDSEKDNEELVEEQIETEQNVTALVFKETSETVYATANVNIRSAYTAEADNVISVLKKEKSIERIGMQEEWSKVLYKNEVCYIKSTYLTVDEPATEAVVQNSSTGATPSKASFISNLNLASDINQLVCVIGDGGSDCTVSFHIKDEDGRWLQQFSVDGDSGSKGISYDKSEGDQRTPAGLYSFTYAFGIKPDPGSLLTFRQITENDYWIDDVNSSDYNSWITSKKIPEANSYEHLIDHDPSYNYALNIDYNSERTKGLGSAIFLHGYNGSGSTTGCIAISEKYMKTLVQEIDSSAKILIVPNSADLVNY